jgi:predicted metal-binding protein
MAETRHIRELVTRARELGADRAASLPASAVVVDERVGLKCRVPLCGHYGTNLMCPPHTPTAAETRAALARYSDVLVVQRDIPLTQEAVDVDRETGADACRAELKRSQNEFAAVMSALEADAFRLGYRYAASFAGGECVLCEACVGASGEPCRHPFVARPSMEAVGIDVVATAAAAAIPVEMPAVARPCWTGLLLID